jgi:CheY-like chemotaxis protein
LVEDNEESVNTFVPYLEAQGCRVIVVRDGAATVQHARQARPDLILMDIQMPGIDGLETTRRLKADEALRQTPIIALTALAMPGDRERCLQAGADAYLSKPVPLKQLVNIIRSHL